MSYRGGKNNPEGTAEPKRLRLKKKVGESRRTKSDTAAKAGFHR